ncbi:cilia- and flagella-associated protein 36 isoform X2 [Arctopsyche grandis]|uniref:cilia- and flagella-associated protein 36 isoform X2 n=1 Tax=Arctopsyche grandis TaxID=121162 RepID=UPI00406D95E5
MEVFNNQTLNYCIYYNIHTSDINCQIFFEPTENGEIHTKQEYLAIHDEYRNLVDLMLGSYMEDIGITSEQFEMACQMSKNEVGGLPLHFHQRLFEQIWAANDMVVFTRMMTQRNVELQLQALELIEQRSGMMPNSFLPGDIGTENDIEYQDASIMEEVKKLSLEEPQPEPSEEFETFAAVENIQQERDNLKSALDNFQRHVTTKELTHKINQSELENEEDRSATTSTTDKYDKSSVLTKPLKEDIEQRQQYLKQQRDKLLTLKRQIREKQLSESAENTVESSTRPKSAKTAKLMLSGVTVDKAAVQDSSLQLRKALAERLRSEVVEKL